MVHGVDLSKIGNLIGIRTSAKVETSGVKLGSFGYGYAADNTVGLERETRVPQALVDKFSDISAEKAIKPDGRQLVISGELLPDGCDAPEPALCEA